jgi:hypothetical protein
LDIIYRLKERRPVVEVTEEINVRIGAHDCAADDTARRSDSGKRGNAIDGNRWPTKHLAIDDDGECANDAAGNLGKGRWDGWMDELDIYESGQSLTDRVITLGAGKEIDCSIKVMLGYDAIV